MTSKEAWEQWFNRLGQRATTDVVNATATLVLAERDRALQWPAQDWRPPDGVQPITEHCVCDVNALVMLARQQHVPELSLSKVSVNTWPVWCDKHQVNVVIEQEN